MALGVTEDVDWKQETVQLALGDVLLLYTDGITEAQNLREEFFGEKRLLEIMQANRGCSPQDTIDALIAEVLKFAGNAPQFDDITLMVVVRALPKNITMKGKVTKGNQLELTVKAKLENLAVIGNFITDAMKQFGIEQETFPVELAVDEACTNIIQHAYSGESAKSIRILFSVTGSDLVIKIRDWGKPFDPDSVPPPDRESELFERKLGGLGVFLIRQMMDEIKYVFYPGRYNELTMTKYIPRKN
jgi:sigma-B regulation protein RsbU (phosphoserine phosphatase)